MQFSKRCNSVHNGTPLQSQLKQLHVNRAGNNSGFSACVTQARHQLALCMSTYGAQATHSLCTSPPSAAALERHHAEGMSSVYACCTCKLCRTLYAYLGRQCPRMEPCLYLWLVYQHHEFSLELIHLFIHDASIFNEQQICVHYIRFTYRSIL